MVWGYCGLNCGQHSFSNSQSCPMWIQKKEVELWRAGRRFLRQPHLRALPREWLRGGGLGSTMGKQEQRLGDGRGRGQWGRWRDEQSLDSPDSDSVGLTDWLQIKWSSTVEIPICSSIKNDSLFVCANPTWLTSMHIERTGLWALYKTFRNAKILLSLVENHFSSGSYPKARADLFSLRLCF